MADFSYPQLSVSAPVGGATAANQVLQITQETAIAANTAAIQANQTNGSQVTQITGTLPLPTGAATSALQSTGNNVLGSILLDLTNGSQITQITGAIPAGTNNIGNVGGLGTAGTPSGGVVSIQGVSGGTAVPISGAITLTSTTANQGTPNTVANAWPFKVTDGTNTAAVKAASTAAAATDPALVVSISPNSVSSTKDAADGPVSPGTAAANSQLIGMVYNSSAQAPTNGQQLAVQSDQYGNMLSVLPDMIVTGQSAQTATVNNILTTTSGSAATNVANYRSGSVQVVSSASGGTFIFECSNDDVNFQPLVAYNQATTTGTTGTTSAQTASASQVVYTFPIVTQYIRLRIATTITGGSLQAFSRFSQAAWTPAVTQVAQTLSTSLMTVATIPAPSLVADQASGAIITTTTSATATPAAGAAYMVNIPVTAATGTGETMSVAVQESSDTGTNWYTVYTFPNITATGSYNSPIITSTGNRLRYVQTITGSSPSFTRAINRIQLGTSAPLEYKNIVDSSIVPSTTNSTTASLYVEGTNTYSAIVNQGAGGSAVNFALDGSDDNVNWVTGLTSIAGITGGATPVMMSYTGTNFRYIRVRVITGVASATIVNVSLIGAIGAGAPRQFGLLTDRSGSTSATPSTSTQVAAVNPTRKYFLIQNQGATAIYVNFTSAAAATGSIKLGPDTGSGGGSYVMENGFVSSEAINVFSTAASMAFMAKEG
jgi:hypothetical protein